MYTNSQVLPYTQQQIAKRRDAVPG